MRIIAGERPRFKRTLVMMKRLLILAALAAVLVALLWYSGQTAESLVVSGFIEADAVRLGSRIGGRVQAVAAEEGDRVTPGQVLIELEPYDLRERRAEAAARLDELKARLLRLENGSRPQEIGAAAARLELAQAQADLAATTLTRVSRAFNASAATQDEMDRAREQTDAAGAQVRVREQELALLKEGTRAEELAEARAAVAAAEAALAAVDRRLEELTIEAPIDAVVEAVDLQPGDLVAPNAPVLSLVDDGHLWVRAYVPEDRLNLDVGRRVAVRVDSFPDRTFAGHVSFISREAEFTPGNVQTPEERAKQVFRIKVVLDEGLDVLRPGMAADVLLDSP